MNAAHSDTHQHAGFAIGRRLTSGRNGLTEVVLRENRKAMNARYVHTNLIARDWRALADFYTRLFGCSIVPPERDYRSPDLDRLTALPNAHRLARICGCRVGAKTVPRWRFRV